MKKPNKILAVILSIIMLLSVVPMMSFAAADLTGTCGEELSRVTKKTEKLPQVDSDSETVAKDDSPAKVKRCSFCSTYELKKDVPFIGFFITIIHSIIHSIAAK